jgi:alcohol dehydrogenase (NADP+)
MKTFTFSNGDQMPMLGLGTWKTDNQTIKPVIKQAINIGYRHLDCAAVYGNEVGIGEALADAFKAKEVARKELWITSKLWNNAHKADDVLPALQKTLICT